MNIFPVPGSMSLPQNEHVRVTGIAGSPHAQLAGLARGLPQDQDVAHGDRALHVPGDDAALVGPRPHADLHLRGPPPPPPAGPHLEDHPPPGLPPPPPPPPLTFSGAG